jgi:putative transposase
MSLDRRRRMIDRDHPRLSVVRQCARVLINRSGLYHEPAGETALNLALMRLIDAQFMETPWYGSRQMARHLRREGHVIGRKRVRRLMTVMGLVPIYQRPRTTIPHPEHRIHPYLLRDLTIDRPNQVWCTDITYIPMRRGFLYLVAVMDWWTRKVLSWRVSNTMDVGFCIEALEDALAGHGRPEIFNSDQGSQGGFKWSSQQEVCCPIGATGQAPPRVFSTQASFGAGHSGSPPRLQSPRRCAR